MNITFYFRLKIAKAIKPVPNRIEPETNGNPAPTKSAMLEDHKKGKQNDILRAPTNKDKMANMFIIFFVIFIDMCFKIIY